MTAWYDVVVAGGGISGLATADAVLREHPGARVLCLDAAPRPGGHVRTVRRRGFLLEGGPSGFLDRSGAVTTLSARLGLADSLIESAGTRRRWILRGGRLRRVPTTVTGFLTSDLVGPVGRARMLMEPFVSARRAEETVAEYASRRLGPEAAALLVEPIVAGVYAGDDRRLSLPAALPHLAALEAQGRSLLFALLRTRGAARVLSSWRMGSAQLVASLSRRLGRSLVCSAPVRQVVHVRGGYEVSIGGTRRQVVRCRSFVSAAPAFAAAQYLRSLDDELADELSAIPYAPVATVAAGYRRHEIPHRLEGYGYLIPRREGTPVLGVLWNSSMYPGMRAPEDGFTVSVILGGARDPGLARSPERGLVQLARAELRDTLGVESEPSAVEVTRHRGGLPQYVLGHQRRVDFIERRLEGHPGLLVGGNGLRGPGMDALVRDAALQASAAAAHLRGEGGTVLALPQRVRTSRSG